MNQTTKKCTKRTFRDRYYSSMNYEQYYLLFGPPTPIVKPLEDPTQVIPELCLECFQQQQYYFQYEAKKPRHSCLTPHTGASLQDDKSESLQQQNHLPNKGSIYSTNHTNSDVRQAGLSPHRIMRERPRSRSDNTEYLIFNFLERINKKGKKKIKLN